MNLLTEEDIEWKYSKHITYIDESHYVSRCDKFNIQRESIVKRDGHGWVGSQKVYYFIDNVEREFTNINTLIDCWNEKYNYDDPNNTIDWVKKIVPIIKLKTNG